MTQVSENNSPYDADNPSDYYPHERLLRRVTISGDKPRYRPG